MKRKTGKQLKKAREFADSLPMAPVRKPVKFHWRGVHHSYAGIWLTLFASFFLYMNKGNNLDLLNWFFLSIGVAGFLLVCDDLYEHLVDEMSPCRRVWLWALNHKSWW